MATLNPVMRSMVSILSLTIYWTGAYILVKTAQPEKLEIFSDMVVFSSYAVQVIVSFMMLSFIFVMLPRVMVSVNRVKELLEKDTSIEEGNITNPKKDIGMVSLKMYLFHSTTVERMYLKRFPLN